VKLISLAALIALSLTLAGCSDFMSGKSNSLFGGGDKDCKDYGYMFWVGSYDPYNLDGHGDGWACEEYR